MPRFAKIENRLVFLWVFVSFMVGVGLLVAGCAGEPKRPTWTNATGAEQNERLMWQAIHDEDWVNVERHLSPMFVGVIPSGRMFDRANWLELWQSTVLREFSLGEIQVRPEGVDMKVTYVFHVQTSILGPTPPDGFRVMSVWQEVKSRWMLSAMSITPIQSENKRP